MVRGLPATLRNRPEILVLPLAVLLVLLNVGPWGYGPGYATTFVLYLTLQRSNEIFPLTWALSVATFAATLWVLLRWGQLNLWRTILVAASVPFLAVALFEIPYELAYGLTYPGTVTVFEVISMATWLAVGLTSVGGWRLSTVYYAFLATFIAGFVTWYSIGFPTIDRAAGTPLEIALAFNIVLKVACFPLAALPTWTGAFALRPTSRDPSTRAAGTAASSRTPREVAGETEEG